MRHNRVRYGGAFYPQMQGMVTPDDPSRWDMSPEPMQGLYLPQLWIPFDDKGNGEVNLVPSIGGVSATFGRTSTAYTRLRSGLWVQKASGIPRSYYTAAGEYLGMISEVARNNRALWCRDFTNAVWVSGGGGITPLKDAVGIDGVANSCSTLTAAGADGTILQSITHAAMTRMTSAHVKRKTGSGAVYITQDNGATWTDITSQLSTSAWAIPFTAAVNFANPIVGFKIATAGDEIIVDMFHCEDEGGQGLEYPSTPIVTTTGAVTRPRETLSYPLGTWHNVNEGTLAADIAYRDIQSKANWGFFQDNNNRLNFDIANSGGMKARMTVTVASVSSASLVVGPTLVREQLYRQVGGYKLDDFAVAAAGVAPATDVSGAVVAAPGQLHLSGSGPGSTTTNFLGCTKNLQYWNFKMPTSLIHLGSFRRS